VSELVSTRDSRTPGQSRKDLRCSQVRRLNTAQTRIISGHAANWCKTNGREKMACKKKKSVIGNLGLAVWVRICPTWCLLWPPALFFNTQAVLMSEYCTNCQSYCLPSRSGVFKSESRELVDKETTEWLSVMLCVCVKISDPPFFFLLFWNGFMYSWTFLIHSQWNHLFSFAAISFVDFIFSLTPCGAVL